MSTSHGMLYGIGLFCCSYSDQVFSFSFSELKKLARSEKKSARLFEFQLFPNFFVEKCQNFAKKTTLRWMSDCAQEDIAKCG
jgi:hypothetical protein